MSYIVYSFTAESPVARWDGRLADLLLRPGEVAIPCAAGADPNAPTWAEEAANYDARHALPNAITLRCDEVERLRDEKLSAFRYDFGDPHGVLTLQLRDVEDRTNWLTLKSTAADCVAAGQGDTSLPLRTGENVSLMRAASEVVQILAAMATYGAQVWSASWAHKDALRALTTVGDVAAYDLGAGWPA